MGSEMCIRDSPSAYRGQPGPAHMNLGITPEHFDRWLALWEQTLPEYMGEQEALAMLTLARRMRPNLQRFAVAGAGERQERSRGQH